VLLVVVLMVVWADRVAVVWGLRAGGVCLAASSGSGPFACGWQPAVRRRWAATRGAGGWWAVGLEIFGTCLNIAYGVRNTVMLGTTRRLHTLRD
jgi:hypothetical protein